MKHNRYFPTQVFLYIGSYIENRQSVDYLADNELKREKKGSSVY